MKHPLPLIKSGEKQDVPQTKRVNEQITLRKVYHKQKKKEILPQQANYDDFKSLFYLWIVRLLWRVVSPHC